MNWTVQNVSADTLTVTDTPIPISWAPGQIQHVPLAYFLQSAQLSQALVNLQLCVTAYGAFTPLPPFAPVTFAVLGTLGATGLTPVILTQNGRSAPLTLGPYAAGRVLVNIQALTSGSSLALGFQDWDGATYYPVQAVGSTLSAVGPVAVTWNPPSLAGRFTWTVVGSVTVTGIYQATP
jgi:hypothetical protein